VGRHTRRGLVIGLTLAVAGCARLHGSDPVQVSVAGVESLQGEGLEARLLVKLRVQNPNDSQIDYDGAYVRLEVQDKTFATGVSDARGSVPRFGEAVVAVPVTVSMLSIARQVLAAMDARALPTDTIRFSLEGKLHAAGFRTVRFRSQGDLHLPAATTATPDSPPP
jgi:hypothetical protein